MLIRIIYCMSSYNMHRANNGQSRRAKAHYLWDVVVQTLFVRVDEVAWPALAGAFLQSTEDAGYTSL